MKEFFERLFMPQQVSDWAPQVDWLNNFITWAAVFCTLAMSALMLYFMIRYRRKSSDQKTSYTLHNRTLEIVWTVIPTLIVLYIFYYGTVYYARMRTPPKDAIEIEVEAYQWGWNFEYPGGKKTSNELVVPLGKAVKLIMHSKDVNHSFFIPVLRVKEDVMAGTYHYMWFTAVQAGQFPIFCAEYCGLNHSFMRAKLNVMPESDYQTFLKADPAAATAGLSPVEKGQKLYNERGCVGCHSLDGTIIIGPSFKEVTKHEVELADGSKVTPDENYLRESMLVPTAKVVKGFQPIMPSFQALLTEDDILALIAFIKAQ